MKKSEIDTYINDNYSFLLNIAKGLCYKKCKHYDPSILISEAYLHVLRIKEQIPDLNTLQRYIIAKINIEVSMPNSKVNIEQSTKHTTINGYDVEQEDTTTNKIERELKIQQQLNQIHSYRFNLQDRVKKIIFDTYFIENKRTVRSFGAYFNFPRSTANKLINQMKEDIKNEKI
jgi:hypothetical protein